MSHYNPDQYTEPQCFIEKEDTGQRFAKWIDTDALAAVVGEELVDQGINPTLENCQAIWLDVLEDLHSLVAIAVKYKFDGSCVLPKPTLPIPQAKYNAGE